MPEYKVSFDEKNKKFTITGDIPEKPPVSKSQKSLLLASTLGNPVVGTYKGKEVKMGLNMYVSNEDYDPETAPKKKKKNRKSNDDEE